MLTQAMIMRLLSVYLMGLAAVVAVYFILSPVIHGDAEDFPIWEVLNYFMAVAVVIAVGASALHKLDIESDVRSTDAVRYFRMSGAFYGAVLLALWFFWRWFTQLNGGDGSDVSWAVIDPLFAIVTAAVGRHLWQGAEG